MNYQSDEQGLVQLLQKLEYVQGTFPPVYMLGELLIGYDKSERIRIIADAKNEPGQIAGNQKRSWPGGLLGKLSVY